MKQKFIDYFMKVATLTSNLSYAKRLQVGAVIVKGDKILATGYNGMPTGWENNCEDTQTTFDERDTYNSTDWKYDEIKKQYYRLKTKPEVLHAESNAIAKVSRSTESSEGATLFCTHAPCRDCAKLIYQAGISKVYYKEKYRDDSGLNFLRLGEVEVIEYDKL